jgi:hypothetical protein
LYLFLKSSSWPRRLHHVRHYRTKKSCKHRTPFCARHPWVGTSHGSSMVVIVGMLSPWVSCFLNPTRLLIALRLRLFWIVWLSISIETIRQTRSCPINWGVTFRNSDLYGGNGIYSQPLNPSMTSFGYENALRIIIELFACTRR